ncbi:exo-1-3-beta-glucanase [Crepidotus variabilis]|uniref:Exo-1-3-beta-glucanase n=1 Tax=Crepidotus variabilis TaxID=179855 RepID=A0A9P6JKN3_9AGAR|nr:exo-1-3-beta-glucanase [Crepidotus variabilis]
MLLSQKRLLGLFLTLAPAVTLAVPINFGFPYGQQKVRGVNLGGWLVLESFITPSLFDSTDDARVIDEYTFGKYQDHATALSKLQQHWDTFITEKDFADIAAAGLNHVRLPIGFWAWDVSGGEPYVQGQLPYLDKAVQWARNNNLKLLIDLHGAPGSQNGFDNSGQVTDTPTWHLDPNNIHRTNAILKKIADTYADQSTVVSAIAPLNEPAGFKSQGIIDAAKQYWKDSYQSIRHPKGGQQGNAVEVIHDTFQGLSSWAGFMPSPEFDGVVLDTHYYEMFSVGGNQMSQDQLIKNMCNHGNDLVSSPLWTVVGEWTTASNDCAPNLNGRGKGSRFDGTFGNDKIGSCQGFTGKASTFSQDYKDFMRKYWEAQVTTYEKGVGWLMWTWKTEQADEWSYQAGLQNGWIPQNPEERRFPNICG